MPAPIERPPTTAPAARPGDRARARHLRRNAPAAYAAASRGASLRACPRTSKAATRKRSRSARSCGRQFRALPPKPCSSTTSGPSPSTSRCSATSPGTISITAAPANGSGASTACSCPRALCNHARAMPNPPLTPIPSSTVMLLRDDRGALEVFMVQRHHQIDFASSALVFPGGKVDPADRDPALRARCTGCADLDEETFAVRVAAVRETFEECGVLLARGHGEADLLPESRVRPLETTLPQRPALAAPRTLGAIAAGARPRARPRLDGAVRALDHPRLHAEALRHPLLPRRGAARPGGRARRRGIGRLALDLAERRRSRTPRRSGARSSSRRCAT